MQVEGSEALLQEENFNCERCPRSFKNKLALGAHKLVHGRQRKKIGRQMKRKKAKYKSFLPPSVESLELLPVETGLVKEEAEYIDIKQVFIEKEENLELDAETGLLKEVFMEKEEHLVLDTGFMKNEYIDINEEFIDKEENLNIKKEFRDKEENFITEEFIKEEIGLHGFEQSSVVGVEPKLLQRVCFIGCTNEGQVNFSFKIANAKLSKEETTHNPQKKWVCEKHFIESDFRRDLQHELLGLPTRKLLKPNVFPSQHLMRNDSNKTIQKELAEAPVRPQVVLAAPERIFVTEDSSSLGIKEEGLHEDDPLQTGIDTTAHEENSIKAEIFDLKSGPRGEDFESFVVKEEILSCEVDPLSFVANEGGAIRYQCDLCDSSFNTKNNLKTHKRKKHDCGGNYNSDQCDSVFTQRSVLLKPKLQMHDGTRFQCDRCDSSFVCNEFLRQHKESKHEGKRYPCDFCEFVCVRKAGLKKHKLNKHNIQF